MDLISNRRKIGWDSLKIMKKIIKPTFYEFCIISFLLHSLKLCTVGSCLILEL